MNPILIAGALVAVILLAWLWWRTRSPAPKPAARPVAGKQAFVDTVTGWTPRATRVLSKAEIKALDTLRQAFPSHLILAQVPLARFIKVPTRNSYAEWLRRAGQLCADLVVCDRYSHVVAVVELRFAADQPNERALRRQKRLERVLGAADVPVFVWTDDAIPGVEEARRTILPDAVDSDIAAGFELPGAARGGAASSTAAGRLMDDEGPEVSEARPETWYDELDTGPVPLSPPDEPKPR